MHRDVDTEHNSIKNLPENVYQNISPGKLAHTELTLQSPLVPDRKLSLVSHSLRQCSMFFLSLGSTQILLVEAISLLLGCR
jgi:hypothetical protein